MAARCSGSSTTRRSSSTRRSRAAIGPSAPTSRRRAEQAEPMRKEVQRVLNKASLVTLWIDPETHQILKYTFDNVGSGLSALSITVNTLPLGWLAQVEELRASMTMGEAFPGRLAAARPGHAIRGRHGGRAVRRAVRARLPRLPARRRDLHDSHSPAAVSRIDRCVPSFCCSHLSRSRAEVIAEVRVHGNVAIAEEEVLRLAEVEVGAAFEADTAADHRETASSDRQISEGRGAEAVCVDRRSVENFRRHRGRRGRREDRMGPGFGRRAAHRQASRAWSDVPAGSRRAGRLRMDLRRALCGAERGRLAEPRRLPAHVGRRQARGRAVREGFRREARSIASPAGLSVSRREHPFYERDDDRLRLSARVERDLLPKLRAGATLGTEHVRFLADDTRFLQTGADLVLDTRLDPVLARNAVYARAAWDRYAVTRSGDVPSVQRRPPRLRGTDRPERAGRPRVPERVRPAAAAVSAADPRRHGQPARVQGRLRRGDTLVAGSAEVRTPITSPLNIAKLGVSAFVDVGTVYDHRARLEDQRFGKGIGGSVWLSAAFFRLNFAVAKAVGGGTRVHFGTSFASNWNLGAQELRSAFLPQFLSS